MQNYIYDNSWSQELEDLIEKDLAKPLIMEMFYKHGLRVYDVTEFKPYEPFNEDTGSETNYNYKYMMTLDGLPYCQVFVEKVGKDKVQYCFYSPYFEKERGKDKTDKRTVRASKISGLMRMLEKYKCVKDDPLDVIGREAITYAVTSTVNDAMREVKNNSRYFGAKEQYAVLNAYMTGTKLPTNKHEEIKKVFDIWHKEVETERHANEKARSLYGNEFYILAESKSHGICIGKAKINFKTDEVLMDRDVEVTDGFQRVASLDDLDDIDDLKPILTMYKVYMEGHPDYSRRIREGKVLVSTTGYNPDLEVYGASANYSAGEFAMNILMIPIGATTS
jgi:hypothetical protein